MNKKIQKPEILSSSVVAKSHIFEIQSIDLRFSNGVERTYERLRPSKRSSILIIPIKDDNMLLIREYSAGTERYELGFPKGGVDEGETPEEGVIRELQEEIGYKPHKLTFFRTVNTSLSFMSTPIHIYLAEELTESWLEGDEPELLDVIHYPLAKIDELLTEKNFYEARSLVALFLLRDHLKYESSE